MAQLQKPINPYYYFVSAYCHSIDLPEASILIIGLDGLTFHLLVTLLSPHSLTVSLIAYCEYEQHPSLSPGLAPQSLFWFSHGVRYSKGEQNFDFFLMII